MGQFVSELGASEIAFVERMRLAQKRISEVLQAANIPPSEFWTAVYSSDTPLDQVLEELLMERRNSQ